MDLSKLWGILNGALENANITGELDGVAFGSVSYKASGKNKFVLKGWIDPEEGPAVKYGAPWGSIADGEIGFQSHPSDNGFQETTGEIVNLETGMGKVSLSGVFKSEGGTVHHVIFTADINLGDLFQEFLS